MKNMDFQRNTKKNAIFLTTGWLFADLLLVLSVIFLVSSSKVPSSDQELSHLMTVAPAVILTITPTSGDLIESPTPSGGTDDDLQVGLDTTPVVLIVNVAPAAYLDNDPFVISGIQEDLKKLLTNYSDKKAGLVITLGYHSEIGMGMRIARKGNSELKSLYPAIFSNSVMKPFWFSVDEINVAGTIKFEVYFLKE